VFFLPALRDLDEHLRLRQEVEADAHAVSRVGARAVAGALYKLLGGTAPAALRGAAASSIATPRRLDHLLGRDGSERLMLSPTRLWPSVGLGVVILCLLVL